MSDSTAFPVRSSSVGVLSASASSTPAVRKDQGVSAAPGTSILVGTWFVVVLAALVVLKLILVISQGEGLYEAHWRFNGVRVNWVNYFAFYSFVGLGGLGLLRLGKDGQALGVRSVRIMNAVVLALGLCFIFLTFHNGDKNYFYPILSGVLKWTSIVPYVANSLFFNQPYLAAWIFVYASAYYVLVRTGRERFALSLTTAFAVAYSLIYFPEQLFHRNELLIADSVGLVSVIMAWRRRQNEATGRLAVRQLIWPLGWTLFFAGAVLRFDDQWHSHSATYLFDIIGITVFLFLGASWFARRAGRPAAWSWLLPFFGVSFFLLVDSNYPAASNYSHLLCLALTSPRYMVPDVVVVGFVCLAAVLYRKLRPKASLWWVNLLGMALIVLAILDLRLTQIMGVRLGWDVLSFGDDPKMMLRMAKPYLPGVTIGLIVMGAVYAIALRAGRIWLGRFLTSSSVCPANDGASSTSTISQVQFSGQGIASRIYIPALVFVMGVLGLCLGESDKATDQPLVRLVRTSPAWKRVSSHPMSRDKFLNTAAALGLGNFAPSKNSGAGLARRDLNVVVVFMESSYNKHLSLFGSSEETQPLLSKYKDRMEIFPNFFSAFTGSIHARFATFTSLYPVLDFHSFTQERVPVKSLFEVFHDQGYTCSMFYSSYFDYTGFRDFLKNRGLDEMYDADTMPGQHGPDSRVSWGLQEEETLKAMRSELKKYAQNHQRFCLTYVPAAPHYPYDNIPKRFQKYKLEELSDFTPRYLNELLYMDWVVASLVDELKDSGLLDNTLVIITNDHGEALGGKDGHVGHGWALTPQLANTPLIVMDPGRPGFRINTTVGSQVDLLPTLLDRLHIAIPSDQLYEGASLDAGELRSQRLAYLNSYKEFGILSGDRLLLGDRDSSSPTGVASTGAAFNISNEGTKTIFTGSNESETNVVTAALSGSGNGESHSQDASSSSLSFEARNALMTRFDTFQENLLRNYAHYVKEIRGAEQTAAR